VLVRVFLAIGSKTGIPLCLKSSTSLANLCIGIVGLLGNIEVLFWREIEFRLKLSSVIRLQG